MDAAALEPQQGSLMSRRLAQAALAIVLTAVLTIVGCALVSVAQTGGDFSLVDGLRFAATSAGLGFLLWALTAVVNALRTPTVVTRRTVTVSVVSALVAALINVLFWVVLAVFASEWAWLFAGIAVVGSLVFVVAAWLSSAVASILIRPSATP
jgi:hypothetical protein